MRSRDFEDIGALVFTTNHKNASSGVFSLLRRALKRFHIKTLHALALDLNPINTFKLPGVQVRNADFRQQMVHQSSLCCKDLTLRHFVVSSRSVRRARVIN